MSGFAHDIAGGQGNLIITSVQSPNYSAGSAGWQIRKDGSAEFNNLVIRGTFSGTNFVINSSGMFFYSGTPASGNLIESFTNAAGTDAAGNAYLQGMTSYTTGSGIWTAANMNGGIISYWEAGAAAGPYTQYADIGFAWNSVNGGSLLLQAANLVTLGQAGNCVWNEVTQQLDLPAGGGPFISGEGFHTVTLATGLSGGAGIRVKKLPWNALWLDVEVQVTNTTTTFTLGSLPDSSYYPAANRDFPLNVASFAVQARIRVPTSGALSLVVSASASGTSIGGSVMYPPN